MTHDEFWEAVEAGDERTVVFTEDSFWTSRVQTVTGYIKVHSEDWGYFAVLLTVDAGRGLLERALIGVAYAEVKGVA